MKNRRYIRASHCQKRYFSTSLTNYVGIQALHCLKSYCFLMLRASEASDERRHSIVFKMLFLNETPRFLIFCLHESDVCFIMDQKIDSRGISVEKRCSKCLIISLYLPLVITHNFRTSFLIL